MSTSLNTIDRCFLDAQDILEASKNGGDGIAKTYSIFANLQPILTTTQCDSRVALLALAIWRTRRQTMKETTTEKRRGVNCMNDDKPSVQVRAKSRTYFIDIEKSKDGSQLLKITESRYMGENKERERSSILVFPEYVTELSNAISEMATKLAEVKKRESF